MSGSTFRRAVVVASLIPLGFGLLLGVIAPGFMGPLFDMRAGILGLPPAVGMVVLLLALAGLSILVSRVVRNEIVVGLVVVVTTTIGLFVVLLAPAIVLIAINFAGS